LVIQTLGEYKELHEAIYNCRLCIEAGYPVSRVQPEWDALQVRSVSIRRWAMLIGQSPGRVEQQAHKAMQGKAGRGWRKWLSDAGFSEDQISSQFYKTVITKCYPGTRKGRDRKPTNREIELCSPFLVTQIQLVDPVVIVPMGKVAVNWFFPEVQRLEEVVGKKFPWNLESSEYLVICLPHASPASAWWKSEANRILLMDALRLLSEQREQTIAD